MCAAGESSRDFGSDELTEQNSVASRRLRRSTPLVRPSLLSAPGPLWIPPFVTDVKDIKVVVNYDFPGTCEDYVHRIGRTGRAGAVGASHCFFTRDNAHAARELVQILEGAAQAVPDALRDMAEARGKRKGGGRGGGRGRGGFGRGGGRGGRGRGGRGQTRQKW